MDSLATRDPIEVMGESLRRRWSNNHFGLPAADDPNPIRRIERGHLLDDCRATIKALDEAGFAVVPKEHNEAQAAVMEKALGPDKPPTRRWHWVYYEMVEAGRVRP